MVAVTAVTYAVVTHVVVDGETGIGIREAGGCIEVIGLDGLPEKERRSLQLVLSLWRHGLVVDDTDLHAAA